MTYVIESDVPMPPCPTWGRRPNPIVVMMRKMEVGQSMLVDREDPNWRDSIIRNANMDKTKHFFKVQEVGGVRIFRDR